MPPTKPRVAIVGCGQIADAHVQEVGKTPSARVAVVCDQVPELARQLAERFGVPEVYDDVGRMLEAARPDVVHITTPPHTHGPLAERAGRLCGPGRVGLRVGDFVLVMNGRQPMPYAHVRNCARAVVLAGEAKQGLGWGPEVGLVGGLRADRQRAAAAVGGGP